MARTPAHKEILVIRLGSIGDVIIASPVASRLKSHHPNSTITWITQPECADLLKGHPAIDRILIWNRPRWRELIKQLKFVVLWQEIRQFSQQLKGTQFDLALDLQGVFKSSFIAWLSNAKTKIALGASEGNHHFVDKTFSRNMGDQTLIGAEYRYMLSQIGVADTPWKMHIPLNADTERKVMAKLSLTLHGESYMVICPFSNLKQRHWPDEHWQQIILRIRGRHKLRTIILGNNIHRNEAEKLASQIGAINLVGDTSLLDAIAIIKNASLLIGVDNGLTHASHAFRVPTVALFGPSSPYSFAGVETSKIIYEDMPCSPCGKAPSCHGTFDCMQRITPDRVLSELKPLIKLHNDSL